MNVAIDTNVIVYVVAGNVQTAKNAAAALERVVSDGGLLVISAPVYAELLALPAWTKRDLDTFISETKIRVDFTLAERCWTTAGVAFAAYSQRRRKSDMTAARRILADFVIGAHAAEIGALLTNDAAFYRTNFEALRLIRM